MNTRAFMFMLLGLTAGHVLGEDAPRTLAKARVSSLVSQQFEADVEALVAADIQLLQGGLAYGQKHGRFDWTTSLSYQTFALDYRPAPFDFLGADRAVDEGRIAAQANGRFRWSESVSLLGGAGVYDGFTNYRSVWLNEYFR